MLEKYFASVVLIVAASSLLSVAINLPPNTPIRVFWLAWLIWTIAGATFYAVLFVIVMQFWYRPSLRIAQYYTVLMGLIQVLLSLLYHAVDNNPSSLLSRVVHNGGTYWATYMVFLLGVPIVGFLTRERDAVLEEQILYPPGRPRSWQLAVLTTQFGLLAGLLLWFAGSLIRAAGWLVVPGKALILLGLAAAVGARIFRNTRQPSKDS